MREAKLSVTLALLAAAFLVGCDDHKFSDNPTGPQADAAVADQAALQGVDPIVSEDGNAVYTLSNESSGNMVLRFEASDDGSLTPAGSFSTTGLGSGAGLGSQGALAHKGRMLFAVNAGSNDVSVLEENGKDLSVVTKIASGGTMPISLTVHGDLLYVLNAGGAGNITGFRGAGSGKLVPIPGSAQALSGSGVAPAQIEFSPDGRVLVVTEKGTNSIDTYTIGAGGVAVGPNVAPSAGNTPFGFEFTHKGQVIVSDAFGGAPNASGLSSYSLTNGGILGLVTGPLLDGQTAACWVTVSRDSRFAYTTNNGSNNITGVRVGADGSLTLFNDGGVTAATGSKPIDMAVSHQNILYALNAGSHTITSYRIDNANGSLTSLGMVGGLPVSDVGLVAE